MRFRDRTEAAQLLAKHLSKYRGKNPLILAVPRGAVEMGEIVAEALGGDLDVILVHKLRAPSNPELAIGSVDEAGHVYLTDYAKSIGVDNGYLAAEKETQISLLRERREKYTPVHPPLDPKGRTVIVVDDGVATGSTLIAALCSLRAHQPAKLIAAIGVAPAETLKHLEKVADEVVCLMAPEDFYAVGQFFEEFRQVSDEEVIEILKRRGL